MTEPKKTKNNPFPIVAIGASVGGLKAVTVLLNNVSAKTGMAFIFVQHLSPTHKSQLTAILSGITKMKVQDIEDMEKMIPDNVYVIPFDKGIKVTNGHIKLIPRTKRGKPVSIDILFSSLAETHKENVVGVVLSGNMDDGTEGLVAIKKAGGITFAQDRSADADSMPLSAIASGVVDFVLSANEIAKELSGLNVGGVLKRN
ncbi:MAG: chemotaxis protein CheB [Bacteroidetes bacterium]|nr:chemotaxis protein CheB [Bacteroidota bacterium]